MCYYLLLGWLLLGTIFFIFYMMADFSFFESDRFLCTLIILSATSAGILRLTH